MKKFLAVMLLSLSFICAGCGEGVPYPVMRLYQDSVGAGYLKYLEADGSLDEDRKRIRRQAVESMEKRLKEAGV